MRNEIIFRPDILACLRALAERTPDIGVAAPCPESYQLGWLAALATLATLYGMDPELELGMHDPHRVRIITDAPALPRR